MSNNIFDGFENSNPEETAKKLGIKTQEDKNSQRIKDTLDYLGTPQKELDFLGLFSHEVEDKTLWTTMKDWDDLQVGVRVFNTTFGKVESIDENGLITIRFQDGGMVRIDEHNEDISKISVFKKDIKFITPLGNSILDSSTDWVESYHFMDLERNLRVRKEIIIWKYSYGCIVDINREEGNVSITVKEGNDLNVYSLNEFYEQFNLYKEDFEAVKIYKLAQEGQWISDFELEDLEANMYVKKDGKLYKIQKLMNNNVYVRDFDNNDETGGSITTYPKGSSVFQTDYEIYVNEKTEAYIDPYMGIKNRFMQNDVMWMEQYGEDDIKIGARLRKLDTFMGAMGAKIIDMKGKEIIVKTISGYQETYSDLEELKKQYQLFTYDHPVNFKDLLDHKIRVENGNWTNNVPAKKIFMGLRARYNASNVVEQAQVIQVERDYITINFLYTEIITMKYEEWIEKGIEFYLEDLL